MTVPDEVVQEKLRKLKKSFADEYNHQPAVISEPFIMVANFLATESMEETVIRWSHRVCSQFQSFEVELNNFSGVPSHTIFLRIQNQAPFKLLASNLKVIDQYIRSNGGTEARFVSRAQLAIAENLETSVYTKAMLDYSAKLFHEKFLLTELLLLKRNSRFDQCRQVNVFRLYPPDVNKHQEVA